MTTVAIATPGGLFTVYGSKAAGSPSLTRGGLGMPAMKGRVKYAPDSDYVDGSEALAGAWQQTMLTLTIRVAADSETAFQVSKTALEAAVGQLSYTTTVTLGDDVSVWVCDMGSVEPVNQGRQWFDAGLVVDYFTVTIPCHPVRQS